MTPTTPFLRPLLAGLGLAAITLSTSGCETTFREDWSAMPPAREAKVDRVRYAHAVRFLPASARLEGIERDRLDEFLGRVQAGPNDTVLIAGPDGDALAGRRLETVSAYLLHRAVRPRNAGDGVGTKVTRPDAISVVVERHAVTLPACPDWSDTPGRTWNNTVSRNWGCATATNLGLMVVAPGDLASGRTPGPMDGEFAAQAIHRYRTGETRTLAPEDVGTIEKQQKTGSGGGQ